MAKQVDRVPSMVVPLDRESNGLSCGANASEGSYSRFEDLLEEVALMQADLAKRSDVMRLASADDVAKARQRGSISFLPTVEHLALSHELHRVDVLYGVGA